MATKKKAKKPEGRDYTQVVVTCPHCGEKGVRTCLYKSTGDMDVLHKVQRIRKGNVEFVSVAKGCNLVGSFGTEFEKSIHEGFEVISEIYYGEENERHRDGSHQ